MEGLPQSAQVSITADMLDYMSEADLQELIVGMNQDNMGCDTLERLKRTIAAQPPASLSRAFHVATPDARMLHLRLLTDIITEPEREALLESLEAVRRHFT